MTTGYYTRSFSNARDGCYVDPGLKLTSEYVQQHGVRVLGKYTLKDPRGTEGQVLIAPNIKAGSTTYDLALIGDMSNNVYAFNANAPYQEVWTRSLGTPITVTQAQDEWKINPFWGILSTGVVDPETNLWYVVAYVSTDGTIATASYWFHTIDITSGSDAHPPVPLNGVTYTTVSGTVKTLGSAARKQRPALTLIQPNGRKVVLVPFGSFLESAASNLGWIVAVDVTDTPAVVTAWTTGDKYPGPGLWMAGAGLAVGDNGMIYAMTGNGGNDPPGTVGESFIGLVYNTDPPSIVCAQWWTPFSDTGADGKDPTTPSLMAMTDDMAMPTNAMSSMAITTKASNANFSTDEDLGSGGPLPLFQSLTGFSQNGLIGAGKHSVSYVVNADDMGNTKPADLAPANVAGNYAKLLSVPFAIGYNGIGVDLMPASITSLNLTPGGYTRHIHGQPVAYVSPDHGVMSFWGAENTAVKAFTINPDFSVSYVACTQQVASAGMAPPGGMPGTMLSLAVTAQKANTAVLWGAMPLNGDANKYIVKGRFCAWGANWDDNGTLIKLWDSADWNWQYSHNKFGIATPSVNAVFLPTYDGSVLILG